MSIGRVHRELPPVVIANLIAAVILTPILVAAWDPIHESMGR